MLKILLYHDQSYLDTRTLRRRLPWLEIESHKRTDAAWDGKYLDTSWRDTILKETYDTHFETVDAVLYLSGDWRSTKSTLLGYAHRKQLRSYFFSASKIRTNWTDTVEHELLHIAEYIIWTYLGIHLADVFGVDDFADEVVHGNHSNYTEYKYAEKVWPVVYPLLQQAIEKRKNQAILSYQEQLVVKLRQLVLQLQNKLSLMKSLLHPVEEYKSQITQGYGVYNPHWYPLTKHHVSNDYATPVGTPVRAPWDGEITVSGYSDALGNFCHYTYSYKGQRYTDRYKHLQRVPSKGKYTRGSIVARTGETGFVTGPHICIDVWINDVDMTIINKNNFRDLTVDPKKHYNK